MTVPARAIIKDAVGSEAVLYFGTTRQRLMVEELKDTTVRLKLLPENRILDLTLGQIASSPFYRAESEVIRK